ncbi:MAG: aldose epimerase family protein [Pseudomonadota bacterium]
MTPFGTLPNGQDVVAIDIGAGRLTARILTLGATLSDVRHRDIDYSLTLGSPDLAAYLGPMASFGSLVGPVANRIKGAEAVIDGQTFQFDANFQGKHTLHGGVAGTHHKVWSIADARADAVTLSLHLPDGEGGFPGNRQVTARYEIAGDALTLTISCTTDAPTLLSFANHSYWRLDPTPGYAGHVLTSPAAHYLEADAELLPTGRLLPTAGSDIDLPSGVTLTGDNSQFFDTNVCLSDTDLPLRPIARLQGASGVTMDMASTAPGLQVFDCGTIDASGYATQHGHDYTPYAGLALEAQAWPGAAHNPDFPSILHTPDRPFSQTTQWRFTP